LGSSAAKEAEGSAVVKDCGLSMLSFDGGLHHRCGRHPARGVCHDSRIILGSDTKISSVGKISTCFRNAGQTNRLTVSGNPL
jgi:hypothetical protein